jgi:hypothetical protein
MNSYAFRFTKANFFLAWFRKVNYSFTHEQFNELVVADGAHERSAPN